MVANDMSMPDDFNDSVRMVLDEFPPAKPNCSDAFLIKHVELSSSVAGGSIVDRQVGNYPFHGKPSRCFKVARIHLFLDI